MHLYRFFRVFTEKYHFLFSPYTSTLVRTTISGKNSLRDFFTSCKFFFRLTCSRRVYFAHFTNKCRPNHFYIHIGISTLHAGISIITRKRWRFSATPFLAVYMSSMSSHGFLRCVPKTLVISVEVYGVNSDEGVKIGFCSIPT